MTFLILRFFIFGISLTLAKEISIQEIPLKGLITDPKQEISGMDWYGHNLFLLPENLGGFLFMIPKNQIQEALDTKSPNPILPIQTIFKTPNYSTLIPGFDGFEAIAFYGNQVYISIEAENNGLMEGYLSWGIIDPISYQITISKNNLKKISTPIQIDNMSYESIVIHNNNVIMIYEANGANLLKDPKQIAISLLDLSLKEINSQNIEYRLTDATSIYNNKFWAINYFWSGDKKKLKPAPDLITEKYHLTQSHKNTETVERLIEFEIKKNNIKKTETEPLELYLKDGKARNWEAIARFDQHGFIIATDKYPRMILGYIPNK